MIDSAYQTYVRPELGQLLKALQLDKYYHRGEGAYLFYQKDGQEIPVLDLIGGYGATLFGHNHPDLVSVLQAELTAQRPFLAQGSERREAGLLAEELDKRLAEITGKHYISVFVNSGAEAVEAALKHAELVYQKRLKAFQFEFEQALQLLDQYPVKLTPETEACLSGLGLATTQAALIAFLNQKFKAYFETEPILLALEHGFHGKTTAALQLTHGKEYREPFSRLGVPAFFLEPGQSQGLRETILNWQSEWYLPILGKSGLSLQAKQASRVLALFAEPLQGEGGILSISPEFMQSCRSLASEFKFPLILDEIQSGMGRTGQFLYSQTQAIVADTYLLSKSLGGGLTKMGVALIAKEVYQPEFSLIHSSTFAEDPLSSKIALESLSLLDREEIPRRCAEMGEQLKQGFLALKERFPTVVKQVRGSGLMLGIEFHLITESSSPALNMLAEQGLLGYVLAGWLLHHAQIRVAPTLSNPQTLRLEPCYLLTQEALEKIFKAFERLFQILAEAQIAALTGYLVGADLDFQPLPEKLYSGVSIAAEDEKLPQVTFLGHFIKPEHVPLWDPGLAVFSAQELKLFLEQLWPWVGPQIYTRLKVTSELGTSVILNFMGLCLDSEIMHRHLESRKLAPVQNLVQEAVDIARSKHHQVLGLGGYNSIVTFNATTLLSQELALTTGNALTVAMGIEAMLTAARNKEIELNTARLAVIGAAGNIASIYAECMAGEIAQIALIGRPGSESRLEKTADRIYAEVLRSFASPLPLKGIAASLSSLGVDFAEFLAPVEERGLWRKFTELLGKLAPIQICTDFSALASSELILGASNSPEPVIFPQVLGKGAHIICDISVPMDTSAEVKLQCPNVDVILGGLVQLPLNPDFYVPGIPLEPGYSFACMAETLLMGLEGIQQNYSHGRLHKQQVEQIKKIADKHGFKLGRPRLEASF